MRVVMTIGLGCVGVACLAAAGCGGSKPSTETQPAPQAALTSSPQGPAATAPSAAARQPQPARTPTVTPVDFEQLVALIPDLPGWTRTPPRGQQSSAGISVSQASAEYTRGDSTIKLEIVDSGYSELVLGPLAAMLGPTFAERTLTTDRKYAAVAGSPGFESWLSDSNEGDVTVVVGGRYVITARGLNVPGLDPVRALVKAVNLQELGTVK